MQKEVRAFMEKYNMVQPGDRIFAAVSGGPDSVCMLLLLSAYCKEKAASLSVVHVNHLIRREASKDAEYVKTLCERLELPCEVYSVDVKKKAKEWNLGLEEAGRKVRYEILEQRAEEVGEKGKIAVAHNKNDLAETTLFHLFRGTSVSGLAGILPIRGRVIRPLLDSSRNEIEEFLKKNPMVQGNWCIDATNGKNDYTRNRIRNVLFPYVEENICHQAVNHVARLANDMAEVREYLEKETLKAYEDCVLSFQEEKAVGFSVEKMKTYPEFLKRQVFLLGLERFNHSKKDITATHIAELTALLRKETGKEISLPYHCVAERQYDSIWIQKRKEKKGDACFYEIDLPGELQIGNCCIRFSIQKVENYREIPAKPYTKCFDYDKIKNRVVIRTRKTGDFLVINKQGNRKSLKEYFIEEKVPRSERDEVFLLADGSHILWVIGKRISEAYKITRDTRRMLQVTVEIDCEDR